MSISPHDLLDNVHLLFLELKDNRKGLYAPSFLAASFLVAIFWMYRIRQKGQRESQSKDTALHKKTAKPMVVLPPPGHVKVSKILIHPIKSCKGISVQSAVYTSEGIEYDRIWSIIDAQTKRILTAREVSKMVLITPLIEKNESLPYKGLLTVSFPQESGCQTFSVPLDPTEEILAKWEMVPQITIWPSHPPVDGYICNSVIDDGPSPTEMLSQYFGKPVHLVYKGPQPRIIDTTLRFPELKATAKYQDMYPLLILSEESTVAIDQELRNHVGTQGIHERWADDNVAIERFRPNIVLKGGGPFAEDAWQEISIGTEDSPLISLVSRCTRCLLPNVSPETGERDAAVPYKVIMKFRTGLDPKHKLKPCVGCNAVPAGRGCVQVGDWVYVKKLVET